MRTFVGVGDDAIVESLLRLVGSHRQVMSEIVQHLAEFDDRRIHLRRGFASLFSYCVKTLRFSEDEACRRIEAARLARRFPRIISMIEDGTVTLSVLGLLYGRITQTNAEELLEGVKGLSVRKAKDWLAARFPTSDIPDNIRKLPEPPVAARAANESPDLPAITRGDSGLPDTPAAIPPLNGAPGLAAIASNAAAASASSQASILTPPSQRRALVEPLSVGRFSVRLTVSERVRNKLEQARDLTRHRNPHGALEAVLEMALDALLEAVSRKKLGSAQRPRVAAQPSATTRAKESAQRPRVGAQSPSQASAKTQEAVSSETRNAQARYVPRRLRREAVSRDGLRCAYVGIDGRRCDGHSFLEFDHVEPVALGGTSSPGNVRVLCRAHNRLEAEDRFGKEHVADSIRRAQTARAVPGPSG